MTSSTLLLYTSKTLRNNRHPIVIRLIKDRKFKLISLGHAALKDHWDNKSKVLLKGHTNFKQTNHYIQKKKNELDGIILTFENENKPYTLNDVEAKFITALVKTTVFSFCTEVIQRLTNANKVGNAAVYKDLLRNLKKYRGNKDLSFSDLTYSFLQRYEEDFLQRGVSENSISVYMRTLRALLNKAIKEGYAKEGEYPFKTYSISKLNTKTRKRAITKEEILKIIEYQVEENTSIWHSKNYFLFSFYNIGMNFSDIARLRWSNIINARIQYTRAKTGKLYDIKVQARTRDLLDTYSNQNEHTNDYVFPVLNEKIHKSAQSIKDRITKINKRTNSDLKEIANALKIQNPDSITHYVARHSWATIQRKNNNTDISIISASMGHADEKTTKIYLEDFENTTLDEANAKIL
jgi:integrase